jgi:hypothetical protein
MWIAVSWLSVKNGDVVVVKAARHGRTTWGGWSIGGAHSSLDMQPGLEVLFSDDTTCHQEVLASSNNRAPLWATKSRSSGCPQPGSYRWSPSTIARWTSQANTHRFISALPDRFRVQVGERGVHSWGNNYARVFFYKILVNSHIKRYGPWVHE